MRLGMKHVLLSFCLSLAAVFAPTTPIFSCGRCDEDGELPHSSIDEIVVATTDQHEVHAVVVDMPQRASLEYASPEIWGALPTFDPPTRNLQQNRYCR